MKRKNLILLFIFALVAAAQLAAPGRMIYNSLMAEQSGAEYKFRIAPRDPVDFLRGRYLRLNIQPETAKTGKDYNPMQSGGSLYAVLEVDENGYAAVTHVTATPPEGQNYVRVLKAGRYWGGEDEVSIDFPFSRYYMNEDKAQAAEVWLDRYAEGKDVYLVVRVHNGYAAVMGLYVDGKTIEELIGSAY